MRRSPKKIQGQAALSVSCSRYTSVPPRERPSRQASQPATATIGYSSVHTGPNTHEGGVQAGFDELRVPVRERRQRGAPAEQRHPEAHDHECGEPEDVAPARDGHAGFRRCGEREGP